MEKPEGIVWFWIGTHAETDKLLKSSIDNLLTHGWHGNNALGPQLDCMGNGGLHGISTQ